MTPFQFRKLVRSRRHLLPKCCPLGTIALYQDGAPIYQQPHAVRTSQYEGIDLDYARGVANGWDTVTSDGPCERVLDTDQYRLGFRFGSRLGKLYRLPVPKKGFFI